MATCFASTHTLGAATAGTRKGTRRFTGGYVAIRAKRLEIEIAESVHATRLPPDAVKIGEPKPAQFHREKAVSRLWGGYGEAYDRPRVVGDSRTDVAHHTRSSKMALDCIGKNGIGNDRLDSLMTDAFKATEVV